MKFKVSADISEISAYIKIFAHRASWLDRDLYIYRLRFDLFRPKRTVYISSLRRPAQNVRPQIAWYL
jgi:hypothetical protein